MINSFLLCFAVKCTVRWAFLYHVVWNRQNIIAIQMRLELMNQLLDCFLAGVILLLDGRTGQSLDPEVNFTATTFVERSTATGFLCLPEWSKDVLASELVG